MLDVSREASGSSCCNKFSFEACACDRQGPEKLVVYEKSVTNVPRVVIMRHMYIKTNDTLQFVFANIYT